MAVDGGRFKPLRPRACDACRKRKIRCDGLETTGKNCSLCASSGCMIIPPPSSALYPYIKTTSIFCSSDMHVHKHVKAKSSYQSIHRIA
ncbi:hypothetical protein DL93DRAFT_379857 [Clavulina sp. PMI_390]|nr:hypothetical protein DL93DRAFT_379857 [Clavulina sp. PMI_390]